MRRLAFALFALVLASGCNNPEATHDPDLTKVTYAPSLHVDIGSMTKLPGGVYYQDEVVGSGTTAVNGKSLDVWYTGWLTDGTQFDSNISNGRGVFTFTLGAGQVIEGWDQGLVGMKVGGKRKLVIPPSLAYGAGGQGAIPGNAVLVFEVQLSAAR